MFRAEHFGGSHARKIRRATRGAGSGKPWENMAVRRRASRRVKRTLLAAMDNAEGAIHDFPIGIEAQRNAEIERLIGSKPIEPVPIVKIAIRCNGMRDRFRRLMDGKVIES